MKVKINSIVTILLIFCFISSFFCFVQSQEKPIEWDFVILSGSLDHIEAQFALAFAKEVEKRTDGKLKIFVHVGGELPYQSNEYIRVTGQNKVQLAGALVSATTGDLKAGALTGLQFLYTEMRQLNDVMEVLTPFLNEELEAYGCQLLWSYPWPPQVLWGKGDPIKSVDGMRGKKFRAQGVEQAAFLKGIGAIPISIGSPEVAPALQRGIADGVITGAANLYSTKWYELVDWGYMLNMQTIPSYVIVNNKAFENLPSDIKKELLEVSEEFDVLQPIQWEREEIKAREALQELGIKFIYPSQEEIDEQTEKAKLYWEEWVDERGGKSREALEKIKVLLSK
jgi:TRAP-type C4-dicarboxylate transport system substrate-binding protein